MNSLDRLLQVCGWLVDNLDKSELGGDIRRKQGYDNIISLVGVMRGRQADAVNRTDAVLADAEAEFKQMRELLESVEWVIPSYETGTPECPNCGNRESQGHTPTCLLKEALGK